MLSSLKQKLMNNVTNMNVIIGQLSQGAFVYNLSPSDLDQLVNLIEGKQNIKVHPKIMTTIYSILIMKKGNYNAKLAIQNLSKYYRSLIPNQINKSNQNNKDQCKKLENPQIYNKTRMVIANLLIRIPTFSNYQLILKDITPQLLPLSIILQHKDKIYKQCPNIYKTSLIKNHKHIWYKLVSGDDNNFPMSEEFKDIRIKLEKIWDIYNGVTLYQVHEEIDQLVGFLRDRINYRVKEQINIEEIFNQIHKILNYEIQEGSNKEPLPAHIRLKQEHYISEIKTSTLQLLRLIVIKLRHRIYRKLVWITQNIDALFNRPYDSVSIEPSYLISFFTSLLQVYGIGYYNFDMIVHNQNGTSLFSLISALAYNDYSNNNKNVQSLINYQNKQKTTKNHQTIHINLYNTTVIDTAYEFYLKKTNEYTREVLLNKSLQFFYVYYQSKLKISAQYYHVSQIMGVLNSSKNKISERNREVIERIKNNILWRGFKHIGEHFQLFCYNMFENYVKKKNQRKLDFYLGHQLSIQPASMQNKNTNTNNNYKGEEFSSSVPSKFKINNTSQQFLKKQGRQFGREFEGWEGERAEQRNQKNEQKQNANIQTRKKCSDFCEQKGEINGQELGGNNDEREFVITPQL